MKDKNIKILFLSMPFLLIGCHQNISDSETDEETIVQTNEIVEPTMQTNETVGSQEITDQSDLVTLVVDNPCMTDEVVEAVNTYLMKHDCTYRIEGMNSMGDSAGQVHKQTIEGLIDSGKQIDIVYGGDDMFTQGHWSFIDL